MKQFVSIPVNGFLFWRISSTTSLKHCLDQYGRYFSIIKPVHQEMFLGKPIVDSKKEKNVYVRKRFSSSFHKPFTLMDFEVWSFPKFEGFKFFRDIYNFYLELRQIDNFSITEFDKCSVTALQVVTSLLSKQRFSELKDLLTPDCEEEVKKNLQRWRKDEISFLAFRPEDFVNQIVCDFSVFSDKKNKEKKFMEIRVIYYLWLEYSDKLKEEEFINLRKIAKNNNKVYVFGVYNCKFIRDVTKGSNDQWRIKKINLKCF